MRGTVAVGLHQRAEVEQPPCPGRWAVTGGRRKLIRKPMRWIHGRAAWAHVDVAVEAHVTRKAPSLREGVRGGRVSACSRQQHQKVPGAQAGGGTISAAREGQQMWSAWKSVSSVPFLASASRVGVRVWVPVRKMSPFAP